MIILPAGASKNSWTAWDEQSEFTLDVDQDGDGNGDTFICFFENPTTGGDETGRGGGLSGSDLVLTQAGNIAGATGSPPTRYTDGSDDSFNLTTNFAKTLFINTTWTIIAKGRDVKHGSGSNNISNICQFYGNSAGNRRCGISMVIDSSEPNQVLSTWGYNAIDDTQAATVKTTAAVPTTGDVYFIHEWDGTTRRMGFSTTKPTSWDDIPSSQKITLNIGGNYTDPVSFDQYGRRFFNDYNGGNAIEGYFYYVIVSKVPLLSGT